MQPLRLIRTMIILLVGLPLASAQVQSQDQKPLPTHKSRRALATACDQSERESRWALSPVLVTRGLNPVFAHGSTRCEQNSPCVAATTLLRVPISPFSREGR